MPDESRPNAPLRRPRSAENMSTVTTLLDESSTHTGNQRVSSLDGGMLATAPSTSSSQPVPERVRIQLPPSIARRTDEPRAPTSAPASSQPLTQNHPVRQVERPRIPIFTRIAAFLGLGRHASRRRKLKMDLIQALAWGLVQVVVIVVVLILTGTHFRSTRDSSLSEWKACDRPLGVWSCIWILRVCLRTLLRTWEYAKSCRLHATDEEANSGTSSPGSRNRSRSQSGSTLQQPTIHGHPPLHRTSSAPTTSDNGDQIVLPYEQLYSRLSLVSSLLTLSWYLTAHILEYTSIKTCRHTSPHLWWLVFGILCIMYLMVLEVLILGIFVFIVGPVIFLVWNVILITLGRHPLQNPTIINPEIGKLPKSIVERIPLVMYIPPAPVGFEGEGLAKPETAYTYPPGQPPLGKTAPRTRFKFLRRISFKARRDGGSDSTVRDSEVAEQKAVSTSWESSWEQGELPFVVLEDNRAACAICLTDFEAPKKKQTSPEATKDGLVHKHDVCSNDRLLIIAEEERNGQLRLEDAGEGAQPLRLLQCGHVFHQICLDPWLTDVSGRCPVCQRAVEVPPAEKKPRRRHHRRNTTI
ncbi:hypothetical protein AX17_005597 [Amanita inopinata Kibby_2008]|nr:hypothetical protein AX17_005597 [Amanita inopinata Kibby_2008]